MKVREHKGICFCALSLFTGLLTMARPRPVSAVSTPAPPNPNSRNNNNSTASPLSKAMEALDMGSGAALEGSSIIRSKLVQEETTLEDRIVNLILDGQWGVLQPNSGKSVVIGDGKSVSVSYQEEPGSGYRTWEWHGHVMVYEDGEGYMPEYVYGNYFEPLEEERELVHMGSMTIGFGGLVSGVSNHRGFRH